MLLVVKHPINVKVVQMINKAEIHLRLKSNVFEMMLFRNKLYVFINHTVSPMPSLSQEKGRNTTPRLGSNLPYIPHKNTVKNTVKHA